MIYQQFLDKLIEKDSAFDTLKYVKSPLDLTVSDNKFLLINEVLKVIDQRHKEEIANGTITDNKISDKIGNSVNTFYRWVILNRELFLLEHIIYAVSVPIRYLKLPLNQNQVPIIKRIMIIWEGYVRCLMEQQYLEGTIPTNFDYNNETEKMNLKIIDRLNDNCKQHWR